ncbi:hypothetical protein Q7F20_03420, partial [Curtobacterium sp. A7_M15]
ERGDLGRVDWCCGDLLELVRFGDFVVNKSGTPPRELSQVRPVRADGVRRQGRFGEKPRRRTHRPHHRRTCTSRRSVARCSTLPGERRPGPFRRSTLRRGRAPAQ